MNMFRIIVSLIILSFATGRLHAQSRPVGFDWFEYSGRDGLELKAGDGEYRNPILAGFYPDPSICRVGDDFYLVNSTFAYYPGIPVFHSRDLVNWVQVGNAIHRPDQLRYDRQEVSKAIFAPTIRHHDGLFYVICTMVGGEGNFIVTATNAAGPWSNAIKLGFEGIDPSIFFDDDGRAWVVNNGGPEGKPQYNGHRAIWIQQYDIAGQKMTGQRKVLVDGGVDISKKPIWIEGPHIYRREGWYYLCCAEGGTGPQHSQVIFRSRKVDGPYAPWEGNPILTQRGLRADEPGAVTCTGHADLVIGPDNNWWAVFLGVRPYQGKYSPMGRETFMLPVTWTEDGWPVILPQKQRVPLVVKSPANVLRQKSPAVPLTGDFVWRDDFTDATLSPLWIMLRTPNERWWTLDSGAGKLKVLPRADELSGRGNPGYLARRIQHARFTASTLLEVPGEPGVSAGLAVFQGERHHYFFGLNCETNGVTIFLEQFRGPTQDVIKTAGWSGKGGVRLRMSVKDAKCSFEYADESGSWQSLVENQDATLLTTEVAGGFVGATVGPHVRINSGAVQARLNEQRRVGAPTTLKDAYKDFFMIGVALNQRQYSERDAGGVALALREYNSISPENVMKWENIHPRPGQDGYDFAEPDRYVAFGEKHGMHIVGHTLIWHSQTPRWVFQGEGTNAITREILLQRMRDHIHTVVGRYKGRIKTWDVVNEALNEDGSLRRSQWYRIIGEDYIAKAFEYAHEADPGAELRYNDYSIENAPKRNGTIALVKKLQAQKAPISGLGSQTHANLTWPGTNLLDTALTEFATLGIPISITELDVDASERGQRSQSADVSENFEAGGGGVVESAEQRLADQYSRLFRVFLKHRKDIKLVTFWGVTDRDSWRRFGTPLLFDGQWRPKPAFDAVIKTAIEARKAADATR